MRQTISIVVTPPSAEARAMEAIRITLVAAGYFEAVTFTFVSDALAGDFLPLGIHTLPRADATVRKLTGVPIDLRELYEYGQDMDQRLGDALNRMQAAIQREETVGSDSAPAGPEDKKEAKRVTGKSGSAAQTAFLIDAASARGSVAAERTTSADQRLNARISCSNGT